MRLAVLCVLSVLLVAACTSDGEAEPSSAATARSPQSSRAPDAGPGILPCADVIDNAAGLPADYEAILDSVALPTDSARGTPSALTRRPGHSELLRQDRVVGAFGVAFKIEVNHPPGIAQIGWGSSPDFVSKLSSEGCEGEGWLAFAGGLVVHEPMCVRLRVTAGDEQESVRVGAGSPCEGQQPPATP